MPKITTGEIYDMTTLGNRVFIAGTFTSIQNQRPGHTETYAQAGLASYNLDTGLVDAAFTPNFAGEEVDSVATSPDGKLYAAGTFSTVNGVTRKGLVRLDPLTGAPVSGFVADTDARATEVVASNTTVYVGGRFTKVNGVARGSLAAVDATTGQVDGGFVNNITQGVGVNGAIGVQRLVLTHDMKKLIVVHTGLQVNGQDRAGVAIIDTVTKQLTAWHSHLWEDNLEFVGGIQRAYGAAIAPDDSYFVVTSGSGGDRPPINDTAVAFPLTGGDDVQPLWIARCFDSVYSVAISEKAVYIGGHFAWNESPTANDPWPGQADIGYGTGQGISAYALGDQVVGREHLGALDPATGKALEWAPASDSFEGNKAMLVTSRGLITGGDAVTQGGANVGRIAEFDFDQVPAPNGVETAITAPIMGRVQNATHAFDITGTASTTTGTVNRVEMSIQDRGSRQYLQNDLTTWGATKDVLTPTLDHPGYGLDRLDAARHGPGQREDGGDRQDGLVHQHLRPEPGHEEVRDLQPRRRTADGRLHRPGGRHGPDEDVHRHRHDRRRQGRRLDHAVDPQRLQQVPPGRRHRRLGVQLLHLPARRPGCHEHDLAEGDHRPRRGPLASAGARQRHRRQQLAGHQRPRLDRVGDRAGTRRLDHLTEHGDPADGSADLHRPPGSADHLHRLGDRRRHHQEHRHRAGEQLHAGVPHHRRQLRSQQRPEHLPADEQRQPEDRQLDLHDAVQPDAGQLPVRGAGDRQRQHHHAVDPLGRRLVHRPGDR